MIKTQLTIQQKLDNAVEWVWDHVMGDERLYTFALYDIGYTREEMINELTCNCGLDYEEAQGLVYDVEVENGIF